MIGTPEERFWAKVNKTDTCWEWTGTVPNRYGFFWFEGRNVLAHRFAYELLVGPIPDGLEIDHLCRNTICVNPAHLEAVPQRTNALRSWSPLAENARKTHCPQGHEYTPENTYLTPIGGRACRTCKAEIDRQRKATKTEARIAAGKKLNQEKTHCPRGHEYTEENTYRPPAGGRVCRACKKER